VHELRVGRDVSRFDQIFPCSSRARVARVLRVCARHAAGRGDRRVWQRFGDDETDDEATSWQLIWSDEFNGAANTGVDRANWIYDLGTGYPGGAANWGSGEIETMTDDIANVYQDGNGHLLIKPLLDSNGNWTSGRIETQRPVRQPLC
jgi:hypothetical protein